MITMIDRTGQFDALTREQSWRVLDGGNIVGLPIQCEYCDQPAAWSSADGKGRAVVACDRALHIAYASSWGTQVYPEDVMDIVALLKSTTNPKESK